MPAFFPRSFPPFFIQLLISWSFLHFSCFFPNNPPSSTPNPLNSYFESNLSLKGFLLQMLSLFLVFSTFSSLLLSFLLFLSSSVVSFKPSSTCLSSSNHQFSLNW